MLVGASYCHEMASPLGQQGTQQTFNVAHYSCGIINKREIYFLGVLGLRFGRGIRRVYFVSFACVRIVVA